MPGVTFEIMRRGKIPRKGDKLVMPQGCCKTVVRTSPVTSECSNPKTCPTPGKCDLSKAAFVRNGKEVK